MIPKAKIIGEHSTPAPASATAQEAAQLAQEAPGGAEPSPSAGGARQPTNPVTHRTGQEATAWSPAMHAGSYLTVVVLLVLRLLM